MFVRSFSIIINKYINRTAISNGNNISIVEPWDCTSEECAKAKEHFYTFVEKAYKGLYHRESNVNGTKSPSSVFCRIDIGLIMNANNEVIHLCLNQFKWFMTVCL